MFFFFIIKIGRIEAKVGNNCYYSQKKAMIANRFFTNKP